MQVIFFLLVMFSMNSFDKQYFPSSFSLNILFINSISLFLWFIYWKRKRWRIKRVKTLLNRHLSLPFVKVSLLYIIFLFWYNLTLLSLRDFSYILFYSKRFLIYAEFLPSFKFLYVFFFFVFMKFHSKQVLSPARKRVYNCNGNIEVLWDMWRRGGRK